MTDRHATRRLRDVAAVMAATGIVILTPSTAWAQANVFLNSAHVGALATGPAFNDPGNADCRDPDLPHNSNQDVWVFVFPGGGGGDTKVQSLTIGWDIDGDGDADQFQTYPADGALLSQANAAPRIGFVTPARWALASGQAEVDKPRQDFFNLTHTCVGMAPTTTPPVSPSATSTKTRPTLPATGSVGAAGTAALIAGSALVATGAVTLLALRRRRSVTE